MERLGRSRCRWRPAWRWAWTCRPWRWVVAPLTPEVWLLVVQRLQYVQPRRPPRGQHGGKGGGDEDPERRTDQRRDHALVCGGRPLSPGCPPGSGAGSPVLVCDAFSW